MLYAPSISHQFADGTFYKSSGSDFYASDEKITGDYAPVRYAREIALVRKYCPRGRVLDVGCSTGGFLYQLTRQFPGDYEVLGTDVAAGALDYAETKGVPVIRENFLYLPRTALSFDAITFWAVLEHLDDPGTFLAKAHALLNRSGRCFVLVPNIRSLATRILGAKYRYILPQHLNYFSRDTLGQLAERSGYRVIHSATMHFNPIVIVQDLRSQSGLVADKDRAKLLVQTNRLKQNSLLAPLRWFYRQTEALLGLCGLADNLTMVLMKRDDV